MSTPLDRLHAQALPIEGPAVAAFVAGPGLRLLVLPGEVDPRPEAQDVAVIALELARQDPRVQLGVVGAGAEADARRQLAVDAVPALVFVKHGRAVSTLTRLQPWAVYARTAAVVFGDPAHAATAKEAR